MKFKALKSFVSGFGTFDADEVYDVRLDKPTSKMWIEHGLIEKVTAAEVADPTPEVVQETEQDPTQETEQEPTPETPQEAEEVKPVETDENK